MIVNDVFCLFLCYFDCIVWFEQLLIVFLSVLCVLFDPVEIGVVMIVLYQDVFVEVYDWLVSFFVEWMWVVVCCLFVCEEFDVVVELFAGVECLLLIVGGGICYFGVEEVLSEFVVSMCILVVEILVGKGVVGVLSFGGIGVNGMLEVNRVANEVDVVICVGMCLIDFMIVLFMFFLCVCLFLINVCVVDVHKLSAALFVVDVCFVFEVFCLCVCVFELWTLKLLVVDGSGFTCVVVYVIVNVAVWVGDWVVVVVGWMFGDLFKFWIVFDGGHVYFEFGFLCMGYEFFVVFGICMYEGLVGEVFVIVGDGSLLMVFVELVIVV